jgi:transglutaminase-like putative cysteine protease
VFAPRFQPFWSIPLLSSSQAKTGMTDRIAPGDIENLSQSTELAFRVTFKDEVPKQQDLYWRGLVLNYFDGQEWRQFAEQYELDELKYHLKNDYALPANALQPQGNAIHYEVVYEKTGQPWLFSLTPSSTSNADLIRGADYRLMNPQPLQAPLLLHLVTYPEQALDLHLNPALQQLALQLPAQGNPKTRALAQQLRAQYPDDVAYIQAVLARYSQQQFTYTLRPPAMGKDSIDSFLFEAKRGFCAHYAGSFVFMLRAAGIPARIVAGYQGGEWNQENHYLAVHQYDAHAWTEVWLADKGWVRIDPTATIAPSRIEQNLESAVKAENSFLANQNFNVRKFAWLNNLRKQLDALQYHWQRWVLGYDGESQMEFLQSMLGELSISKIALVVLGLFASLGLLWLLALGLLKPKTREALEQQLYRRFSQRLAKRGVQRQAGQTPQAFAQQAAQAIPQWQTAIYAFTQTYENLCYVPDSDKSALLQALKVQLNALR